MYSNLSSVALRNVAHLGGKDFPFLMNLSVFGSKNLDFFARKLYAFLIIALGFRKRNKPRTRT